MLKISNVTCEFQDNLLGIDETNPRFSWFTESDQNAVFQEAYHLQIAKDQGFTEITMDSDWVKSNESLLIPYNGKSLEPCTGYFFRVRVKDNHNNESDWSETNRFETGLLTYKNWKADFISPESEVNPYHSTGWSLKRDFKVDNKIKSARIYSTALGLYKIFLNGKKVSDSYLTPGWTNYKKRLLYQVYNITNELKDGNNIIECLLGAGWYKGDIAYWGKKIRDHYGERNALSIQILLRYEDGNEEWICTDQSWKSRQSPILFSEIYHGETYDARMENNDWIKWQDVDIITQDISMLTCQDGPLVKAQEVLKVKEVIKTPSGKTILDFGQNLTGLVRFKVEGKAGDRVVLKHGEVLDLKGELYTDNLRQARQKIEYILSGNGVEYYEPNFTFQGFQYVLIEKHPSTPKAEDFEAVVLHSDMERLGAFECSHSLINQLHKNILWGMKGNFLDIPTDCPQRDERLGWTGDAQVFISTANYLMNTSRFFEKWLLDLKSEQFEEGGVPFVIPDALHHTYASTRHSASGWGDAAVICPWEIYKSFGNKEILITQYESMKSWSKYIENHAENGVLWNSGFHFGDWVALDAKEGSCEGATPKDLIATAFYANTINIMIKVSGILDKPDDHEYYVNLHERIVKAFQDEFITANGRMTAKTQTAHVLSLFFDLVPETLKSRVVDDLVKLIEENDNHLTTGFLGTPYLCRVLSDHGRNDIAYQLLLREEYPSWLFSIHMGATTIWEHWDGIKPDGSMWSPHMNSFNHYAYGAIGHFIYGYVGGILPDPEIPGFKKIILKPHPGKGINWAKTRYKTPYGIVSLDWELKNYKVTLSGEVPVNAEAILFPPYANLSTEIKDKIKLGSGNFSFIYTIKS